MATTTHPVGLTDTCVLIDAFHAFPLAVQFLVAQQAAGGVRLSVVSAMELVAGARNLTELRQLQAFLNRFVVFPITPTASQAAYDLMESFSLSHGLTIPDALIAATALEHRLTLYTRNIRHFQMIPNLAVTPPY